MSNPVRPLANIRVLDLATFVAAPFAASLMSEFGAEVIKIEQPAGGDPWRRYGTPKDGGDSLAWKSEARNKRSMTLDLRKPEGRDILLKLAAKADVLCENFRPGTMEKWGLGWDALSAANPRLVMFRVSGYGQAGPYKDRPGFARIAHAFGGLTHLAGIADGPPVTPGSTSLADYITGLFGVFGVMTALHARNATGRGQIVDVALYESIFRVLDELAPAYGDSGFVRGPEGTKTLNAVPHGQYQTNDGKWIAIACTSDRMFERFCEMAGKPELAAPDKLGDIRIRLANYAEAEKFAADFIASQSRDEFLAKCLEFEVPAAPVNTIADIFADPHIRARQTLVEVPDSTGKPVTIPNVVPRLSETPGKVESLGPALGEANSTILGGLLGLSEEEIARLKAARVV